MGITCKQIGKMKSVFQQLENEQEKEKKKMRKQLKKGSNPEKRKQN